MYKFHEVDPSNLEDLDKFVAAFPTGDYRQSSYWGHIKELSGWQPRYYVVEAKGKIHATALVQKRRIPFCPLPLLYCCHGPVVDWADKEVCACLFSGLKNVAQVEKAICLRLDPESAAELGLLEEVLNTNNVLKTGKKISHWNRCLYTTRMALNDSEESLFAKMRRKNRQNIRTAMKSGVVTAHTQASEDKDVFIELMAGLEVQRNSLIHQSDYYSEIYETLVLKRGGYFLKAEVDGKVVAGLVMAVAGDKAWALFLANDYTYRKLMPNKLLMWEAIKLAKQIGCRFVDLGSTQGTEKFDPQHDPLDNLKNAYRPEIINYPGYFDIPNRFYIIFRFFEEYVMPTGIKYYYKLNRLLKCA